MALCANMTEKQIQKELNKIAIHFEEKAKKGTVVKSKMINDIKAANQGDDKHNITLYSGELESLRDIKDEADYKIILSYDEEGYIYRIDADEQT